MADKKLINLLVTAAIISVTVAILSMQQNTKLKKAIETLPTPQQIQQRLVDRGSNIVVDGRIGNETMRAWEAACCNDIMTNPKFEVGYAGK